VPAPPARAILSGREAMGRKPRPPKKDKHGKVKKHASWCSREDDWGELLYSDGVVYCWRPYVRAVNWQHAMEMTAYSSVDGKSLWSTTCAGAGHYTLVSVHKAQGLVWVNSAPPAEELLGLDPKSGKIVRKHDLKEFMATTHHHRCHRTKATEKYLIYSKNGLEYLDFETGKMSINPWARGICAYGIMPANGLIYAPPQPCSCFPSVRAGGFVAYAKSRGAGAKRVVADEDRLFKGPGYGAEISGRGDDTADWNTYRHDPPPDLRSGATGAEVPRELTDLWTCDLGEPVTAPTVGLGKVFVAGRKTHSVYALDADSGRTVWSFFAGGGVDSPPTIWGGAVYFGAADGFVYCLRASDGRLMWRFDANPEHRLVASYGSIESAWPVHGSVIVADGAVYFASGHISYLDGGLHIYALDAKTGRLLKHANHCSVTEQEFWTTRWQEQQELAEGEGKGESKSVLTGTTHDLKRGKRGLLLAGTHNDIPVYDDQRLHIKNLSLAVPTLSMDRHRWQYVGAQKGMENRVEGSPLRSVAGFLDDSLFSRSGFVLDKKLKARLMVFNDTTMFAFGWGRKRTTFDFSGLLISGKDKYNISAYKRTARSTVAASANTLSAVDKEWSVEVPVRVQSMTLTNGVLFIAGSLHTPEEPERILRAVRREGEGVLWGLDPANGEKMMARELPSPPVRDGVAAVGASLYVSMHGGTIVKLGKRGPR